MAGKVIIVEGLDGVGKSTQVELLKQRYEAMGGNVHVHHFPTYGSPQGKFVEDFLSGDLKGLNWMDIANLYVTDFIVTWNTELKKYYDEDYILIFDRFWPSTVIYQSNMAEDVNLNSATYYIYDLVNHTTLPVQDSEVVFLTGKFDVICAQKKKYLQENGAEPDEIEKKTELLREIGRHATWCCLEYGFHKVNVTKNGEMRSPEDIHEEVFERINCSL